jgi:hypothetical protein
MMISPSPSRGGLGWGWVCSRLQREPNRFQYAIHFIEHLIVPESQHEKSGVLKQCSTLRISSDRIRVLAAIEFNVKHFLKADKIQDVIAEWMRATKLAAARLPQTQALPRGTLGAR